MTREPSNIHSLSKRIANHARLTDTAVGRIQRTVANTVLAQLLPPGVVKGGAAIKFRLGNGCRFTTDLDTTRDTEMTFDRYVDALRDNLKRGWGGFSGIVEILEAAQPADIPVDYVMQPVRVRLAYGGRHWLSVSLEIGRDEVGGTVDPELHIATDVIDLFALLGLPQPDPVALLRIEHQVAQKLHACTDFHGPAKTNDRAHDLVDLQLLESVATFDMISLRMICHRLFIARKRHEWPPIVREMPGWESIYESAARGLPVLPNIGEAVRWANTLVAAINNGEDRSGRGLA